MSGSAAISAPAARASHEPDPSEDLFWEIFLGILELAYRLLNEMDAPAASPTTPEAWIDLIADAYQANGVPSALSEQELADILLVIESASLWAAHFGDTLDPNRALLLQEVLRSAYSQLGGNPVNLAHGQ